MEELAETSYPIDMATMLKCKAAAEIRLYEQMAAMLHFGQTEMPLNKEDYVSAGEINDETGEVYEKEVLLEEITIEYLNEAIQHIGQFGFGQAEYYQVIEKNIGEFYLQYAPLK